MFLNVSIGERKDMPKIIV